MTPEDKIVEAIDRTTEAVSIKTGDTVRHRPSGETWLVAYAESGYVCACGWPETIAKESDCDLIESATEEQRLKLLHEIAGKNGHDSRRSYARRTLGLTAALMLLLVPAKAAPLVSDGDETTSLGAVQVITPHPAWVQPLEGSQWISIAQTGWPLLTWLPNGTVVSFSEVFSLASMPSVAMVSFAADDSASLWLNGALVAAEASTAGNMYSTCSDFAPTCRYHTSVDVLPWLLVGSNEIRFDVAQRGGWSFGLNYAVGLTWLDEPPLATPEPGTGMMVVAIGVAMLFGYAIAELIHRKTMRKMKATQKRNELVAEFVDKQLWQFISLEEWLTKHPDMAPPARKAGEKSWRRSNDD